MKTPLYYMGGKGRAIKILLQYVPSSTKVVTSPFIGGGAFEVYLASTGRVVFGYDSYKPLVSFWKELLKDSNRLADEVDKLKPITREKYWLLYDAISSTELDQLIEAACYFALNRTSFMAQVGAGISTNPNNIITDKLVDRLRNFKTDGLRVDYCDFRDSILKHPNDFLYLDPPYFVAHGTRYYATTSKNFSIPDHVDLFNLLKDRDNWLLSYDNCNEVNEMYEDFKRIETQWTYCGSKGSYFPSKPKELIIIGERNDKTNSEGKSEVVEQIDRRAEEGVE